MHRAQCDPNLLLTVCRTRSEDKVAEVISVHNFLQQASCEEWRLSCCDVTPYQCDRGQNRTAYVLYVGCIRRCSVPGKINVHLLLSLPGESQGVKKEVSEHNQA